MRSASLCRPDCHVWRPHDSERSRRICAAIVLRLHDETVPRWPLAIGTTSRTSVRRVYDGQEQVPARAVLGMTEPGNRTKTGNWR